MWNPVDETFAHKLDPFLPVSEILLLRPGGTIPLPFFVDCGTDELLFGNVEDDDEAVSDDDPLLEDLSPEKIT